MASIDNRIVNMEFNNREFEKNINTSINSLDSLKKSMDFKGAEKGFEEVAKSSGVFGNAIDSVKVKFDALNVVAMTVLTNITNSAINAGKRIASALTIEPIKTGFNEYEQKMDAVRVIMASTGEDLDTVNRKIQELNKYADDTIYSFSDMTLNIGKFTNAGVKLDDAVAAIKGVSNEAARSGANANEASRAMYNFAQALSMGYVQLIDWKSIENANMATVEFKNELLETALAEKTITKTSNGMYKTGKDVYNLQQMFKDGLKDQWLTSEVLIKTLKKYSDTTTDIGKKSQEAATQVSTVSKMWDALREAAQSGWGNTWEIIIGDLDEAKKTLTEVSNVISGILDRMSDSRNQILREWKELGGRDDIIESFRNIYKTITSLIKPVQEAFREIFPKKTGKDLADASKRFKEFTESLMPSEETLNKIKSIFSGLFSVLKLVTEGFKGFVNIVKNLAIALKPIAEVIFDAAAALGNWISGIRESTEATNSFEKVSKAIRDFFIIIGDLILKATNKIRGFFGSFSKDDSKGFQEATDAIVESISPLEKIGEKIKYVWDSIKGILSTAWNYIKEFGKKIKEALEYFFGGELHFDTLMHALREIINLGILNGFRKIIDGIGNTTLNFGKILENVSSSIKNIGKALSEMFEGIGEVFGAWKKQKIAEILKTVSISLLLLAAALFVLSKIDSNKLWESMGGMTVMLTELLGSLALISKIVETGSFNNIGKLSVLLISFSASILILAGALKKISEIKEGKVGVAIVGITFLIGELVAAARLLTVGGDKTVLKAAGVLIGMAIAVDLLTIAVKQLENVDWPNLGKGLVGIFGLLMMIVASVNMMDKKIGVGSGVGLVLLASSIIILGKALKNIGSLDLPTLTKGLSFMAAGLFAISIALNAIPKNVLSKGTSILIVSTSLLLIGQALKNIGSLDIETLSKGLGFMAGGLLAVSAALVMVSKPSSLAGAASILIVSGALIAIGGAMKIIGSMDWDKLKNGMIGIGVGLAAIVIALRVTADPLVLAGAAGILIVSSSLIILAEALKIIGQLEPTQLILGLAGLVGLLAIVAGASVLLTPLIPAILGVGAALAVFGAALLLCTAPLAILVDLMKSLIEFGGKGVAALTEFLSSLISMLPELAKQFALGIVAFSEAIASSGDSIIKALTVVLISILDSIINAFPKIMETASVILEGLIELIVKFAPKIVEAGWTLLMSFLKGIRDNIQELVEVGTDIIINFIKGIEEAMPRLVDEAFNLIIVFIDTLGKTIKDKTPILVEHVWDMAANIVQGLWEGLLTNVKKAWEKISEVGTYIIDTIKEVLGIHSPSTVFADIGGNIINGLINGLKNGLKSIGETVEEVGENIINGFKNFFHIKSPSRLMKDEVGNYIVEGIAEGIKENTSAEDAARIKAQNIANAFKTEIDKIDLSRQTNDLMAKLWESSHVGDERYLDRILEAEYEKDVLNEDYIYQLELQKSQLQQEKARMQIEQTKGYLSDLKEKEKLAKGEYDITVREFGEESDEAKKAYNSYLQAQINTIDKMNDLEEQEYNYNKNKKDIAEAQRKNNEAIENSYYEWIIKNTKALKQVGYTNEQIQKAAKDATGFDPHSQEAKMESLTKNATLNSMQAVQETYQENAESTFGSLSPEFESYGQEYGTNLAKGLESEKTLVVSESVKLSEGSLDALNDHTDEYYKAGQAAGKAYTEGLKTYSEQVLNSPDGLGSKENSAISKAYAKKTSEIKDKYSDAIKKLATDKGVDVGVAYDMLKADALYGNGSYTTNEMKNDYKELNSIATGKSIDAITKVLNSSSSTKTGIKSSTSSSSAKVTSSNIKSSNDSSSSSSSSSSGTTVNYTQNISSPKSISTSEVYRQTKTLISAMSGTVGGSIVASQIKSMASKVGISL